VRAGLPTGTPTARKLWQVSEIFQQPPFPGELVDYNEAQLDWCLEMYAKAHPDEYTFRRVGQNDAAPEPERLQAWDKVLIGKAKKSFMPKMPLAALKEYSVALGQTLKALRQAVSK
jgi:hypothetical protein